MYHGGFESIFTKKKSNCVLKNVNIFLKLFKWLLTFMKFIVPISHAIPHTLNHVYELYEKFD
jgi:hypothetical protein